MQASNRTNFWSIAVSLDKMTNNFMHFTIWFPSSHKISGKIFSSQMLLWKFYDRIKTQTALEALISRASPPTTTNWLCSVTLLPRQHVNTSTDLTASLEFRVTLCCALYCFLACHQEQGRGNWSRRSPVYGKEVCNTHWRKKTGKVAGVWAYF